MKLMLSFEWQHPTVSHFAKTSGRDMIPYAVTFLQEIHDCIPRDSDQFVVNIRPTGVSHSVTTLAFPGRNFFTELSDALLEYDGRYDGIFE